MHTDTLRKLIEDREISRRITTHVAAADRGFFARHPGASLRVRLRLPLDLAEDTVPSEQVDYVLVRLQGEEIIREPIAAEEAARLLRRIAQEHPTQ